MNRRQLIAASLFGITAVHAAAETKPLPDAALRTTDAEQYWKRLRDEQFLLPEWRAFLNNGSLGVAPRPVLNEVARHLELAANRTLDEYPRWGYETLDAEREEMAAFLGCKKDELAFTHNATEALSIVGAGLELKEGDEVVMTDQEHVSGQAPWHLRAARHGVTVRQVKVPVPAQSSSQLADLMISAIGPKTRVLAFSSILSSLGTIMPVREICTAARAKGVLTLVDGAHANGQIPVKLSELNCDFFAGSPHKWMFAPPGCGILYIREEHLETLWPSVVTGGWDDKSQKAARFMKIGTNNRALIAGMMAGLRFLKAIGPDVIYSRQHQLAKMNYEMASKRPYVKLLSSPDPALYNALISLQFTPGQQMSKMGALLHQRRVFVSLGEHTRVSTHIHTRPQDLELFYRCGDEAFGFRA